MSYSIEPAYLAQNELIRLIMKASMNPINKWFFGDGCFSADSDIERSPNTWRHENFIIVSENEIVAYIEASWSKPLNIINNFRLIYFNKQKRFVTAKAIFEYFDYLFVIRGCKAINWFVAEKNYHAHRIYDKFIRDYYGHEVGVRHSGQMAYDGEVSDVILYEITREEYFVWKENKPSLKEKANRLQQQTVGM